MLIENSKTSVIDYIDESTYNELLRMLLGNARIINEKERAEEITILRQDIRATEQHNLLADGLCGKLKHEAYLYFTLPLGKLKLDMYRLVFKSNAQALSGYAKKKIERILEAVTEKLGFEKLPIPPATLRELNTYTIYKASYTQPVCADLIEQERTRPPKEGKKVAFTSTIAGKPFHNYHGGGDGHPRVYNLFTNMSSVLRKYAFKSIYGVDMVEVDFTNSITQCLAKMGKCEKMLNAIATNTLLDIFSPYKRKQEKDLLNRCTFSMLSRRLTSKVKQEREDELRSFLLTRIHDADEVDRYIQAIHVLPSMDDLFRYEDVLRDFCKEHECCISLHDAVYIPAERQELIDELTDTLTSQGYLFKVRRL